jgi:hypothetical protein
MELLPFLQNFSTPSFFDPYSLIVLQAKAPYPALFTTALRAKIKQMGHSLESINAAELDFALLRSSLETSFLGMNTSYWISLTDLDERKQRQIVTYLSSYQGPHTLFITADEEQAALLGANTQSCTILIPPHLTAATFTHVAQYLYPAHLLKGIAPFSAALFKRRLNIPIDTGCLLMHYATVLGTGLSDFMAHWVDKIVLADTSLFTLSQYFFARDTHRFFTLWRSIKDDYPEVFWLTYWSEQLFRACIVVNLQRANNPVEAKKMSFRLPFSFMQKDWRLYSSGELKNAHNFVYAMDYKVKNGGMGVLELMYTKFFLKAFDSH